MEKQARLGRTISVQADAFHPEITYEPEVYNPDKAMAGEWSEEKKRVLPENEKTNEKSWFPAEFLQ